MRAIFPGKDYVDQLKSILQILGSPSEQDLCFIKNKGSKEYLKGMPRVPKSSWSNIFPKANPGVLDILEEMLKFNPNSRITAAQALSHTYVEEYSDPDDEPVIKKPLTIDMELDDLQYEDLKGAIFSQAQRFRTPCIF